MIDRPRMLNFSVQEINFGGRAADPRFADKRSEMWQAVAKGITEDGGVLPNNSALKADLCVPRYSFDTNNRMKLESKDDIKA